MGDCLGAPGGGACLGLTSSCTPCYELRLVGPFVRATTPWSAWILIMNNLQLNALRVVGSWYVVTRVDKRMAGWKFWTENWSFYCWSFIKGEAKNWKITSMNFKSFWKSIFSKEFQNVERSSGFWTIMWFKRSRGWFRNIGTAAIKCSSARI